MLTINTRIKELRLEKEMTQKQLANTIGTTEDSVYSWEKGRAQPSVTFIISLVKYFGVTADYLLGIVDHI